LRGVFEGLAALRSPLLAGLSNSFLFESWLRGMSAGANKRKLVALVGAI
jgi:hypothetical protein